MAKYGLKNMLIWSKKQVNMAQKTKNMGFKKKN